MSERSTARALLAAALLLHAVLAGRYLLLTPAFEGPDEYGHLEYARHLLEDGDLPLILGSAADNDLPRWREASMAHHPPLYYGLLAATLVALGERELLPVLRTPPREGPVEQYAIRFEHGYDERAPVSREVRAFRVLRAWSVLFGAITVALAFALGREVFPDRPLVAGGAAVALACVPTWSFSHAVLDNGNASTALGTAALVLLARGLRAQRLAPLGGALLGLVTAAALLTKLTSLVLLPLVAAVGLHALWRWPDRRRAVVGWGIAFGAVVALLSASFFARNVRLYGDAFGEAAHRRAYATALIPEELRTDFLLRAPRMLFESGLGSFGWGNLGAPRLLLGAAVAALVASALGWILGARRWRPGPAAGLLALASLGTFALAMRYNATFNAPQGRYLFAAYAPFAVLCAAGWVGALDGLGRGARWATWPAAAAAAGLALWVLEGHARPVLTELPETRDRWFAAFVSDVESLPREELRTIELVEPSDGASLSDPPFFHWNVPDARAGARFTIHFRTAAGRFLLGTFESGDIVLDGTSWRFPAEYWPSMPAGEPIQWRVQGLPNRELGQGVRDAHSSPFRSFTRTP